MQIALTIAGSDSGGGAGIQADLKTFQAFGVFGTSAIVALTAQNTRGVQGVHLVPLEFVRAQIASVVSDLTPSAFKTGMLGSAALVETVADAIVQHELRNYVLDPVIVATSGDRLLDADAETAVVRRLLPLATLVTPNLDEAAILSGRSITGEEDMRAAARTLVSLGARAALIKGGHLASREIVDLFWDGAEECVWRRERLPVGETHGTGCTLSAAVAAGLALGRPLVTAVDDALAFVQRGIETAPRVGGGARPLNHAPSTAG